MTLSDETLMAFIDGELAPEEREKVAAALAADPTLMARAQVFERTRALAHDAFAPLLNEPVPPALRGRVETMIAARKQPNVTALPQRRHRPAPVWLSLAAALAAIVIGVGGFLAGRAVAPAEDAAEIELGTVPPGLAAELASKPSGTRDAHGAGQLALIASFRTAEGRLCREFEIDRPKADTIVAVACREASRAWTIVFAVAAPPGADSYAPASSMQVLENYLAATGAGAALSPEEERAALSN
jgi:hypothetical protein